MRATKRGSEGGAESVERLRGVGAGRGPALRYLLVLLVAAVAWGQDYWYPNDQRMPLPISDQYAAAQTTDRSAAQALLQSTPGAERQRSYVAASRPVVVLSAPVASRAAVASMSQRLRSAPGVARPLNAYGRGEYLMVETDELLVYFRMAPAPQELAGFTQRYGLVVVKRLDGALRNGYLFRLQQPVPGQTLATANTIFETERVRAAMPNFMLRMKPAQYIPDDPLFADQWHLHTTGQPVTGPWGQAQLPAPKPDADINAPEAWDLEKGQPSITVAVIDDAVDIAHPEFSGRVVPGWDTVDKDNDPSPDDRESEAEAHGTAVAGVIAAAQDNGLGVSGVAPGVSLMGIRVDFGSATVADYVEAFEYAYDHGADVINCSWGQPSIPGFPAGLPLPMQAAIDQNLDQGRGGRGALVVFAAGNDARDVAMNGLGNYERVLTVAASNDQDTYAVYTNWGDNIDLCAPSNDANRNGLATTDLTGAGGYDAPGDYSVTGDYTNVFGGTSAATPVVSGVIALMLSANPALTRGQVEQMLIDSARKIDPVGGRYDGSGHSMYYGYGKVDALGAVNEALGLVGTPVTLNVETERLGDADYPGVLATTEETSVLVTYHDHRGREREIAVWDGAPQTVRCLAGTTVTFAASDQLSAGSPGASQRWIAVDPPTARVGDQPRTMTGRYWHQLRRSFRTEVVPAGAPPIGAEHAVDLRIEQLGQPVELLATSTAQMQYADTGSPWRFGAAASDNRDTERWLAADTRTADEVPGVPDGLPDEAFGVIAAGQAEVVARFYHQVMPRVTLQGTNAQSTVSLTQRRLFGRDVLVTDLYGQFQQFCDSQSTLGFTAQTTGSPVLAAAGPREFTVTAELDATVRYVIQPRASESTVRVIDRSTAVPVEAVSTNVPANGRTPVEVVVTIRDSAGNPVAGVEPGRVDVFAEPAGGVTVTKPTAATDSTGRLTFQVLASGPQEVTFTAALDGVLLDDTATAQYLQVLSVPLSAPGIYLLSFPITPDDSHRTILDFNVDPSPAQVARLIDGTTDYAFFRPDARNQAFDIQPGRGFYLRTRSAATLELTGPQSDPASFEWELGARGFHQLGNPMVNRRMLWRLADFEIFKDGASLGLLSDPATWRYVDPFVWVYHGNGYELVVDPVLPGTDGLQSDVGVFEGFFWRSLQDGVRVVYTPASGRGRGAAEPLTPGSFGVSVQATSGDQRATVVVGAQRQALRAGLAPELPAEGGEGLRVDVVGEDGGLAALDYVGRAVVGPQTWRLRVQSRAVGQPVTLNWAYLSRQLPVGYRARLTDPTNQQSLLLNTHSSYTFTAGPGARELHLTVLPRSVLPLTVQQFQPAVTRGRSVTFQATVSGEAELFLRVTSLGGRLVAETAPVTTAGVASLAWDGRDLQGRVVPRGTYQVTLVARNAEGETARAQRTVTVP